MKIKKMTAVAAAALMAAQMGIAVSADQVASNPYTSGTTSTSAAAAAVSSEIKTTATTDKSNTTTTVTYRYTPYGYYYNGVYYPYNSYYYNYNTGYYVNGVYYPYTYNTYYYPYSYGYYGYSYEPYFYGYDYGYGSLTWNPYYYSDANYFSYMGFKTKSQVDKDNKKEITKGTPYITNAKSYNGWADLTKYAKEAKAGYNMYITLNGAQTIPAEILSAVKGKNVYLVFTCDNGAVWSINGRNITEAKAISPLVEYNINYIPNTLKKKALKGASAGYQLGLTTSFDSLGCEASVTVKVSALRAGSTAQVYRYNEAKNSLTPVYRTKVSDKGTITFDITAGGPYYITVS